MLTIVFQVCAQQPAKEVAYDSKYTLLCANTQKIKLVCAVPHDIPYRQKITDIRYSLPPNRLFSQDGNSYAEFLISSPKAKTEITISVKLTLYQSDYNILSKFLHPTNDSLSSYLQSEKYIECDDPEIIRQARKLTHKQQLKTVENIYNFVINSIQYTGFSLETSGASKTLQQRQGDCTEFADLFVALCRADSIPARTIVGHTTNFKNTPDHSWAEVYFKEIGWIPFDPTPGNYQQFKKLQNRYIYLSAIRNEKALDNYQIYAFWFWGKKPQVEHTLVIH